MRTFPIIKPSGGHSEGVCKIIKGHLLLINLQTNRGLARENEKYYLYLNKKEFEILLQSLIDLRNSLIRKGRYVDCVDDIIIKLAKAKFR